MEAKFSPKVKEVITYSKEEALRLNHNHIDIEHLLLGLLREGDSVAVKVLRSLNIDIILLRKALEDNMRGRISHGTVNASNLPLTKSAEKTLKVTVLEAKMLKNEIIGTEHLMLSILKNKENAATHLSLIHI